MTTQTLLTSFSKVTQVEQLYYLPSTGLGYLYTFLGRVDPWGDDANPPVPTQDQLNIKNVLKNMFVAKKVNSSDLSPVIPRIDWITGTVYSYYTDKVDMFTYDVTGLMNNEFYVKNKYDQVFKCLWNNNGAASTVEPYFQPGQYNSNNIYLGTDGYKWKYIYTIDLGSKIKFMDTTWMPVPVGVNYINPLLNSAGYGSIDVINVTNGGSGYDTTNAAITVTITDSNLDAVAPVASANVVGGVIRDIIVTSPGQNYTAANVTISSSRGSGATAIAPVSPIGGHGIDPISELGCNHIMVVSEFNDGENGVVPTDITYYQVGVLVSPVARSTTPLQANGSIYKTSTDVQVSNGPGNFTSDEIVYQGTSLSSAYFKATVLSFDQSNNLVKLINTSGTPANNQLIYGSTSGSNRMLLNYSEPDYVPLSGYVALLENRSGIQRSSDGIEQFKFVLGY